MGCSTSSTTRIGEPATIEEIRSRIEQHTDAHAPASHSAIPIYTIAPSQEQPGKWDLVQESSCR